MKAIPKYLRRSSGFYALITTLLLHGLLFFYGSNTKKTFNTKPNLSTPSKVSVVIKKPITLPTQIIAPSNKSKKPKPKSKNPAPPSTQQVEGYSSAPTPTSSYSSLLPKAGEISSTTPSSGQQESASNGDESANGPYKGLIYQEAMINAHILQGAFDIPLFLRNNSEEGSAFLEVEPLSDSSLNIDLLRGDPYLRSLIWMQLKDRKVTAAFSQLAKIWNEKVIKLKLKYVSRPSSGFQTNRYTETIQLKKGQILITVFLATDLSFGPKPEGVPLPDYDAKLAVRVDRLRVSALEGTVAFQKIIRNETVSN